MDGTLSHVTTMMSLMILAIRYMTMILVIMTIVQTVISVWIVVLLINDDYS